MFRQLLIAAVFSAIPVAAYASPIAYQFFCRDHAIECVKSGPSTVKYDNVIEIVQSINHIVNSSIDPKADSTDVWTLFPSAGDCEDYALSKRSLLRQKGLPTNSMKIGIYTHETGETHAVLIIKTDKGNIVLDNLKTDVYFQDRNMRQMI